MIESRKLLAAALAALVSAVAVNAEPYLAMRTGFKCSQCHVNRIGGGERTEYGSVYTQYKLLMNETQALMKVQEGGQSSFNPKLNESVTIGGNFRVEEKMSQEYSYKTSAGTTKAKNFNQANIKEANIYINVDLVKNFLNLYLDETMAPNAVVREMYGMMRGLPLNSYVKVGHMLLPYGIRLMDDDAFIRNMTGYTYNTHDLGGEIGLEPGPVSVTANLTNNQFSSVGSVVFRHFRLGASYGAGTTKASNKWSWGPFVGGNYGRFTGMAEMDFIKNAGIDQMAQFYELDFLPLQGLNTKVTYEYFDRNMDVANSKDGQQRWTFGVEPFVNRFLQLGLYYRINDFIPQAVEANQDDIVGRVHVFF
ncbi:MAG TPA: hypothetical protein DCQ83_02850 [Fibrobacteres bacterium]|jgi:hypothetical protein|nr:hypothetical protein [Fibrobacterota bacterium]